MTVQASQRHTRARRCAICGGADGDPRGKDKRCFGWTTDDGEWVHCSREELAGAIDQGPDQCFAHRMRGPCRCGQTHGTDTRPRADAWVTYDYRDAAGVLRYQVVRKPGKQFVQRRPDGAGGWIWNMQGVARLLFRTPELLANPLKVVHVVEGEKDVLTLAEHGVLATTNPGGAGKWSHLSPEALEPLRGRDVIVIADNDAPGRTHAAQVVESLRGFARSVSAYQPPAPHKDVSDLFAAGGGLPELVALGSEEAEVEEEPERVSRVADLAPVLPFDELWTPVPDADLVVPGLGICPGPAHLVTGSWYTGKTLFLMTLGFAIASGRDLFGLWRVKQGRWKHLDMEMGDRGMRRYAQRIRAGLGIDPEELRGRMDVHPMPTLNLCTPDAVDLYTELLDGVDFCTIDPLRAAAPGQDENDSTFRQWLDMLGIVSNRTKCSIGVLHHGGKPTEGAQRRNTGRGTSAIDDAVQTKLVLTADEKGAPIHVSHEKTRELPKTLDDFWLEIVSGPDFVRLEHRDAEQMAGSVESKRAAEERAKVAKAKDAVRAAFSKYAGRFVGTRDHFIKMIGGKREVVSMAVTEMVSMGEVASEGRGEERVWFPVPNRSHVVPGT